ncbi:MAG: hypothetical protein JOS17DRAFT_780508 [Linnemannia elongata]|nr:MAG: hypothetical protein JOS17DRAFT_780508 [Linnemannia elongata]
MSSNGIDPIARRVGSCSCASSLNGIQLTNPTTPLPPSSFPRCNAGAGMLVPSPEASFPDFSSFLLSISMTVSEEEEVPVLLSSPSLSLPPLSLSLTLTSLLRSSNGSTRSLFGFGGRRFAIGAFDFVNSLGLKIPTHRTLTTISRPFNSCFVVGGGVHVPLSPSLLLLPYLLASCPSSFSELLSTKSNSACQTFTLVPAVAITNWVHSWSAKYPIAYESWLPSPLLVLVPLLEGVMVPLLLGALMASVIPLPTLALTAPLLPPPVDVSAAPCTIVDLPSTKKLTLLVLDLPDPDGDVEEGEEESEEEGGDRISSQDVKLGLELPLLLLSPELGTAPVEGEITSLESKTLRALSIRLGEVVEGDGIDGEEEEDEAGVVC